MNKCLILALSLGLLIPLGSAAESEIELIGVTTTVEGDFDGDGGLDSLFVVDYSDGSRELHLSTASGIRYLNSSFLLGAMDGGVMGDPLQEILFEKGSLYLSFAGGSRERWSHSFVFQWEGEDFVLVSYTTGFVDTFDLDAEDNTLQYDFRHGAILDANGVQVGTFKSTALPNMETLAWEDLPALD